MIVALAGGVGGAKLAHGLYQALPPDTLTVIGNTGDDLELWGLHISPDLDTVMYTLAGRANPDTGWGVNNETWSALDMLAAYGQDIWFRVGDRDLATHLVRTDLLRQGHTLTGVTADLLAGLDVRARLLPMTNDRVRTLVDTDAGRLPFQVYFVQRHQQDTVLGGVFEGADQADVTPEITQAIDHADAIILCPSNPIVSIGPILAVPLMRDLLDESPAPKIAVSPIVGGQALRGPADKMLISLGHESSALGVARLYQGLVQGFVIDEADAALRPAIEALNMRVLVTPTVMHTEADRLQLAHAVLAFATTLTPATAGAYR
jgi:LPPG:FO 2-phospho-L-lactate transferase